MNNHTIALLLCAAATLPAAAQTLQSARVSPTTIAPGAPAQVMADFDISGGLNCNVRVHFGDGQTQHFRVNQEGDAKMSITHTWAKAGTYQVKVEPKTNLPMLMCNGKTQTVTLKVVAPASTAVAASSAKPTCPAGWALMSKSVNKKSGAYTCTAPAGTAAPAPLACSAPLKAFADSKRRQIGCRA